MASPLQFKTFFTLKTLKKLVGPILSWFKFPLIEYGIASDTSSTKPATRFIYGGHGIDRGRFWAKRILGDHYVEIRRSSKWAWQVKPRVKELQKECIYLLVETSKLNSFFFDSMGGFNVPLWFQLGLHASLGEEKLKEHSFRLRADIPRLIRKHDLSYEISHSLEDFYYFVENMHVPFIRGRHDDVAFIWPIEDIKKIFLESDLVFITKGGKRIAGVFLHCTGNMATMRFAGVLDNNIEHLNSGAVSAFYYFSLIHSIHKKMEVFNFGGSSPFLRDGLTYFKLSFRPFVFSNDLLPNHKSKLFFFQDSPVFEEFAKGNGFLHEPENGVFSKIIFIDSNDLGSEKALRSKLTTFDCDGVADTTIMVRGNMEAAINAVTVALDGKKVSFRPIAELFNPV